ncbi:MAG: response regulator [Proteobacteria bacterium]|nr:response regulator [Pseudomonadota bacterium]
MTSPDLRPAILYVDDEIMMCRVFRRILAGRGAPIETFIDPELALAYAHAHPIAAIVCDYRMPTCTGIDLLERLTVDVPFVLVSGDIGIGTLSQHPRISHVLAKPFQPERLIALVDTYLARADSARR